MQPSFLPALVKPRAVPALTAVKLAALTAQQVASLVASPPPQLLIDCGGQFAPHPLGVSHFVSQLLQLRQRGINIQLCNVHPVLSRCLHRLQLAALFPRTD